MGLGLHCQYDPVSQYAMMSTNNFYSWTLGDDWPNNGEIDIIEGTKTFTLPW
jgi:hypothetical protein